MRINKFNYYMLLAKAASMRSTCLHRQVGCVLVDKFGNVMSTGYNGAPKGCVSCDELNECRCGQTEVGTKLGECVANHAESNAIMKCKNIDAIEWCFTTTYPCASCIKALCNTSVKKVMFIKEYPVAMRFRTMFNEKGIDTIQLLDEYEIKQI